MATPTNEARQQIRAALDLVVYAEGTEAALRVLQCEGMNLLSAQVDTAPTDEFLRAIGGNGSLVITCEFCKRTYFGHGGDYDKGELEGLRAKAATNPKKYIEVDDFSSWGIVNGKQFVFDCPCNGVRGVENWLWAHRYVIETYFQLRAQREREAAERAATIASNVTRAVNDATN